MSQIISKFRAGKTQRSQMTPKKNKPIGKDLENWVSMDQIDRNEFGLSTKRDQRTLRVSSPSPFIRDASSKYLKNVSELNKAFIVKQEKEFLLNSEIEFKNSLVDNELQKASQEIQTLAEGKKNCVDILQGKFRMFRVNLSDFGSSVAFEVQIDSEKSSHKDLGAIQVFVSTKIDMSLKSNDFLFFSSRFDVVYPPELSINKFYLAITLESTRTILISFKQKSPHPSNEAFLSKTASKQPRLSPKMNSGFPFSPNKRKMVASSSANSLLSQASKSSNTSFSNDVFSVVKSQAVNFEAVVLNAKKKRQKRLEEQQQAFDEYKMNVMNFKKVSVQKKEKEREKQSKKLKEAKEKKKEIEEKNKRNRKEWLTRGDTIKAKVKNE